MTFKVKTYAGPRLGEAARLILDSKLYIPGWQLAMECRRILNFENSYGSEKIAIGFLGAEPVALVLKTFTAMAFCRLKHRRKGYASRCLAALDLPENIRAEEGVKGSGSFWSRHNVPYAPFPFDRMSQPEN